MRSSTSEKLQGQLEKDKDKDDEVLKLLLLGAGESGKSTLLKQIIHLHGRGFDEQSRISYKPRIFQSVIVSMKTLISQSSSLPDDLDCHWGSISEDSVKYIHELKLDFSHLSEELARHIKKVWADPGIKNTYAARSRFQLSDECKWFFERIEEIGRPDYVPSYQDILRARQKTTGIVETTFMIKKNVFRISDVGGQRNERKKWFHCFEHVITAVIFVAAINEYDQVLYEDGATNRLHETLELFSEICNSRWLTKTAMILFLNKSDLFREKMKTVDMKCCFSDYEGGDDYNAAIAFLKQEFIMRNATKKKIYVHVTCATDTENVEFTFNVAKDVVVRSGLKECGLL